MKALARWVALVPLLVAVSAGADVLEIPLSEVLGAYPDGQIVERTASFDLGFSPTRINGAWIQFTGTATTAVLECDGGSTDTWRMEFYVMLPDDTTGGQWIAFESTPISDGIFAFSWVFATSGTQPATWDFLADGTGEVVIYGGPMPLVGLCGPITPPPEALIDEAVLVLDLEAPITIEARTWGDVKALFTH